MIAKCSSQGNRLRAVATGHLHPLRRHWGVCLRNNAARDAPRSIAAAQESLRFKGSRCGGDRAAKKYRLIVTTKVNDVDP